MLLHGVDRRTQGLKYTELAARSNAETGRSIDERRKRCACMKEIEGA
jgi:hypothetical protein